MNPVYWEYLSLEKVRPDLLTPDGRTLSFYSNIILPGNTEWQDDDSGTCVTNEFEIHKFLAKRGVVEMPEKPAVYKNGSTIEGLTPVYVDRRIGIDRLDLLVGVDGWLRTRDSRLGELHEVLVSPFELADLLTRGIEETGIGSILEQMRAEDAARPRVVPDLDINAVMRNMRDQLR